MSEPSDPISVIMIDDDLAIMQCVGDCLERIEHFKVLGYAEHAQAGVALAAELRPDVVLCDIHMPGADAFFACTEIIRLTQERTKVLFYTGFPRELYLDRAIAAGASGMVCKHSETIRNVGLAIRHVMRGESYFSPELAKRLLELENGAPHSRLSTLTRRELEVIRFLSEGNNNSEIAEILQLSLRSVEKEISDIKRKLELKSTNELIMFAAREGLSFPELSLKAK